MKQFRIVVAFCSVANALMASVNGDWFAAAGWFVAFLLTLEDVKESLKT